MFTIVILGWEKSFKDVLNAGWIRSYKDTTKLQCIILAEVSCRSDIPKLRTIMDKHFKPNKTYNVFYHFIDSCPWRARISLRKLELQCFIIIAPSGLTNGTWCEDVVRLQHSISRCLFWLDLVARYNASSASSRFEHGNYLLFVGQCYWLRSNDVLCRQLNLWLMIKHAEIYFLPTLHHFYCVAKVFRINLHRSKTMTMTISR